MLLNINLMRICNTDL